MNVTMKAVLLAGACAMPLWGASAATANFDIQSLYNNPSTTAVYGGTGFVGVYGGSYTSQYGALLGLEYDFSSTLLQVDISSLAGATINSAQLSFDLVNGTTGSFTTEVTRFTADGTIEYSFGSPDDLGSATFATSGLASNAFDVTSLLSGAVGDGSDWFGLHLANVTSGYYFTYSSAGSNPDAARVRLTVDYTAPVPVPAAGGLLAMALGTAWLARRRTAAA